MKTTFCKTLSAAALLAIAVHSSQAALLLYDGFEEYTVGSGISGLNGGGAFGGAAWSPYTTSSVGQTIQGISLSYSAGSVVVNGGTKAYFSNSGVNTFLTTRNYSIPSVADGESIFVSYLMQSPGSFDGTGTGAFTQVGLYTSDNWGAVTFSQSGDTQLGVRAGSGSNVGGAADDLQNGVTYFIVQEYRISGANTVISTWLNPTSLTLGTPNATSTGSTGSFNFTQLRIRGALNASTYYFDEFRIGTTIADVVPVPEPGSMQLAVLGLAALGVILHRRRSRSRLLPA